MPIFSSDVDGRRFAIRGLYYDLLGPGPLGRQPESEAVIQGWLAVWSAHGGEAVKAAIRDSGESKARAARQNAPLNGLAGLASWPVAAHEAHPEAPDPVAVLAALDAPPG